LLVRRVRSRRRTQNKYQRGAAHRGN
jgi:hypothetical protein